MQRTTTDCKWLISPGYTFWLKSTEAVPASGKWRKSLIIGSAFSETAAGPFNCSAYDVGWGGPGK